MSSPFSLLRLPRVVLCEVLKSLSIGEKILLSLCSKRISTQINNAQFYSQKVIVNLDMLCQGIRVHSENNKDTFEIFPYLISSSSHNSDIHQFPIAGCSTPGFSIPTGIKIFWNNHREGFLYLIRHLLKMFKCNISADISYYNCDILQPVIFELFDLQVEFKKLTISLNGSEDEHLFWNQISNKLGLVEDLIIYYWVRYLFRPDFISWPQNITIMNSTGVTLRFLFACTSPTITLFKSLLDNNDLDVILRRWKTGGLLNLEHLQIQSELLKNNGTTILGMKLWDLDGMVIQNDDGSKKATIRVGVQCIEMSVTSSD
ncbi:hypothetical protein CRE_21993 [Caenorhabditis remanei]|uniref:F-box domain-containing protein n=1 Tax=Caenorhabditis remanei TaxID=31234 RepID=E3N3I3_CAERE|nr:hypothetical protein CRE_21993 [Caenorhabditis remanei]